MFNQYPAYLYILRTINKKGRKIWKIGITTRSPAERLAEITADGRRHNDPTQHAQIYCVFWLTDAAKAERRLHQHYNRLQHKGLKGSGKTEWFEVSYPLYAVVMLWRWWLLDWLMRGVLAVVLVGIIYLLLSNL